jgi:hypothetical protein
MSATTQPYDPAAPPVDEATVSYEPPRSSSEVGHYFLVDDPKTAVVWVIQPQAHPMDPATGFFALYTGDPDDYAPNVQAIS